MPKDLKEKIIEILVKQGRGGRRINIVADQILALLTKEKKKWVKQFQQGKICHNCGAEKESNLTDLCGKCLEEE